MRWDRSVRPAEGPLATAPWECTNIGQRRKRKNARGCCNSASDVFFRRDESRELGRLGRPRSERAEEEQDSIADRRWLMSELVGAISNDGHLGERNTAQWRYLRTSQR